MATDQTKDSHQSKYLEIFKGFFPQLSEFEIFELEYGKDETWDSLTHLRIVSEIQNTIGKSFTLKEIIEFNSFEKGLRIITDEYKPG